MSNEKHYLLLIDTNKYAGNFERDMGAYLTGVMGEYFPGGAEKLAEMYRVETQDEDDFGETYYSDILGTHDWDGEHEPSYVTIADPPKGPRCSSVSIIFLKKPPKSKLQELIKRAFAFPEAWRKASEWADKNLVVKKVRLIEVTTTYKEVPLT